MPGGQPVIVDEHTNSSGETVSLMVLTRGTFRGQRLLVVTDEKTGEVSTLLLDPGTIQFLRRHLNGN